MEGLQADSERKPVIFDAETIEIQKLEKYEADTDALEKGLDGMMNKIENDTSDAINLIE